MTLRHISYDKIAESVNEWNLNVDLWRRLKKFNWIVTEKIHGANFCFLTDGQRIECAKRKQILNENEKFFGYSSLLDDLRPKILEIFKILKSSKKEIRQISVYGELFGGSYPHSDVPKAPGVRPVQTGIWYDSRLNFISFDILIFFNDPAGIEKRRFLDYDEFENVCQACFLLYSRILFKGTFEDCLNFNYRFPSTIPHLLGLPKLDTDSTNLAEGIVIKMEKSFKNHKTDGFIRLAVKRKIAEFDECDEYNQSEKLFATSSEETEESRLLSPFVTENRMINALSKFGSVKDISQTEMDEVLDEFVADVLDAYYTSGFDSAAGSNQVKFVDEKLTRSFVEEKATQILQNLLLYN